MLPLPELLEVILVLLHYPQETSALSGSHRLAARAFADTPRSY
jgi:hypothetical protein